MASELKINTGLAIKKLLKFYGIRQTVLSAAINCSNANVSLMLNKKLINMKTMLKICEFFSITPVEFMALATEVKDNEN